MGFGLEAEGGAEGFGAGVGFGFEALPFGGIVDVGGGGDDAGAGEFEGGADAVELGIGFVGGDVDFGDGLCWGGAEGLEEDAETGVEAGGVVGFSDGEGVFGADGVDEVGAVFGLEDLVGGDEADLSGIVVGCEVVGEELGGFGEGWGRGGFLVGHGFDFPGLLGEMQMRASQQVSEAAPG